MSGDPARARFAILNLVRLAGLGMVLLALVIEGGKLAWPHAAVYLLLPAGLACFFFVPWLLVRKWRTPEP